MKRIIPIIMLAASCLAGLPACGGSGGRTGQNAPESELAQRMANAVRLAEQADRAPNPEAALELYDRALAEYEELAQAWNGRGVALLALDRYLEAAESFRRASDLWPDDPRPPYNLGLAYYNRRYFEDARKNFAEAIRRAPNHLPSLIAAIECDRILNTGDADTLEWIKRVLMSDVDTDLRDEFSLYRIRIENRLKAQREFAY